MQFDSYEDRRASIRAASEALGRRYGEMKFAEQMFRETCQSFVKGEPEKGSVPGIEKIPAVDTVGKTESKAKPKISGSKKTKVPPKDEAKADMPVNTEEEQTAADEPQMQVNTESGDEGECPINSVDDLRAYLTQRYQELGGTQDVRGRLLAALEESTGCKQAADVPEDKFAIAYTAIKEVD